MEHIDEIEINEHFEENDFVNYLNSAKMNVIEKNGNEEIEFELGESIFNKIVNGYQGQFVKYKLIQQKNLIGYLESFKSNEFNYMIIYTSPV